LGSRGGFVTVRAGHPEADPFRRERWAAPKNAEGRRDHHSARTNEDSREFVNGALFAYFAGFKQRANGLNTIEFKIVEVLWA
jgi:type I restriction enzyme M protein